MKSIRNHGPCIWCAECQPCAVCCRSKVAIQPIRPGVRSAAFANFELRFAFLYRNSPETRDSTSSWFQGVLHFKPARSACWLVSYYFGEPCPSWISITFESRSAVTCKLFRTSASR